MKKKWNHEVVNNQEDEDGCSIYTDSPSNKNFVNTEPVYVKPPTTTSGTEPGIPERILSGLATMKYPDRFLSNW